MGLAAYLHSKVETEKAEPRRKLPGGQSSPQSLRGIASIVVPMGKRWGSYFGGLGFTVNGYICCLLDMAPSLAIGAEAMDAPICGRHCFIGLKLTAKRCTICIGHQMKRNMQVIPTNL